MESRRLAPATEQFDAACNGALSNLLRRGDLEGKAGQSLLLFNIADALCERVLLIGCGKERELDERRFRQIASHAATALTRRATEAVVYLTDLAVKSQKPTGKSARSLKRSRRGVIALTRSRAGRIPRAACCAKLYSACPDGANCPAVNRRCARAWRLPPGSGWPRIWATSRRISVRRPIWPNRP